MDKKLIKNKIEKGEILTRIVLELIGKPKDHVDKTIKEYVKKIEDNPNYEVIKKEIAKTKKYQGEMFSTFAELEILFKNVQSIHYFCFDYMPASIEILEPDKLSYDAHEITGVINEFQSRLHSLDMALKEMRQINENLNHNFTNLLKNHVMQILKVSPKSVMELEKIVGIKSEKLGQFLKIMEAEKKVKEKEGKYYLNIK